MAIQYKDRNNQYIHCILHFSTKCTAEIILELIRQYPGMIHEGDDKGIYPIHLACQHNYFCDDVVTIKILFYKGMRSR
jgi:hypothetical protein